MRAFGHRLHREPAVVRIAAPRGHRAPRGRAHAIERSVRTRTTRSPTGCARALGAGLPERLRLAVVDSIETPRSARSWWRRTIRWFRSIRPTSTRFRPRRRRSRRKPRSDRPAVFRNLLMGLVTLVGPGAGRPGEGEGGRCGGVRAQAGVVRSGSRHCRAGVGRAAQGAALRRGAEGQRARPRHRRSKAAAAGHPAGRQLVLQTWFGEAGTHLAAGDAAARGGVPTRRRRSSPTACRTSCWRSRRCGWRRSVGPAPATATPPIETGLRGDERRRAAEAGRARR